MLNLIKGKVRKTMPEGLSMMAKFILLRINADNDAINLRKLCKADLSYYGKNNFNVINNTSVGN